MQARQETSAGERGAIRSTLLAAAAVIGGNGLVFLLAAAVLIPPRNSPTPRAAPAPPATPEAVMAPKSVSVPVDEPVPLPGIARASVRHVSEPVRGAAPARRKPAQGCNVSSTKTSVRPVKVARNATPDLLPDGA